MPALASLLVLPFLALATPPGADPAPAAERAAAPVVWVGCTAGGDEKRPPNSRGDQQAPRRRKCRPFILLNPPSPELPAPGAPPAEAPVILDGTV